MKYIDFKTTVWKRIKIPEEIEKEVIEKVKSGEIRSAEDFSIQYPEYSEFYEELLDTSEQMSVEDNDGQSTLELHAPEDNGKDKILWENGK